MTNIMVKGLSPGLTEESMLGHTGRGKDMAKGLILLFMRTSLRGEWREGIPIGQGTFTWSNGDKFAGEYKVGFPWKGALITNKDGNVISKWENGE